MVSPSLRVLDDALAQAELVSSVVLIVHLRKPADFRAQRRGALLPRRFPESLPVLLGPLTGVPRP